MRVTPRSGDSPRRRADRFVFAMKPMSSRVSAVVACSIAALAPACSAATADDDAKSMSTSSTTDATGGASEEPGDPPLDASGGGESDDDQGGDDSTTGSPGGCDPPNTIDIDGACIPSCGVAGGNTCVDAASTMCEGLPALAAHDCAVCCARPRYPAAGPAAFHFIDADEATYWDAIAAIAAQNPALLFVSSNKPDVIPPEQWAAYLSYRHDPPPTAQDINALLVDPVDGPRMVMLEELHNDESEAFFVALANEMRTGYPQWQGRWGVFVGFADYPLLGDGIDAILQANALLSLELYPRQSEYCGGGSNGGERDIWLAEQFAGNAALGRLNWLVARRELYGSTSEITPLFGVGDVLLDGNGPSVFLDRMFYVWVTRTDHAGLLAASRGGPGAYKWTPPTPLGYGVGNTSRDLAFAESFAHYSELGLTSSRLGPVDCP